MSENVDGLSERVLSKMAWDWMCSALDEDSPDTDRWYLAVSLLIGSSLSGSDSSQEGRFSSADLDSDGKASRLLVIGNNRGPPDGMEPRWRGAA